MASEATETARLPIRVPPDLKVRCKGDYYKSLKRLGILQVLVPNVWQ
jgi:hypothetical protein